MTEFRIGALEVARVEDFVDHGVPLKFLLPELDDDTLAKNRAWLAPRFLDAANDTISVHIQSWLMRTRHHTILVDTCVGNHKTRHFPPFHQRDNPYLANLKASGAAPEEIDYVFCTHLHSDHVGWNTRLENGRWVPTFPNAKHLFARADVEGLDPRNKPPGSHDDANEAFLDSVLPILDAGLAEIVDGVHAIGDGLTILPAPGHSPGHCALRVEDGGESALFTGDSMHHPLQIAAPHLNSFACVDAEQARASRRMLLEECCEQHRLIVPGHFAAPHRGRVSAQGDAFAFHAEG